MAFYYKGTYDVPLAKIYPWIIARTPRTREGLKGLMASFTSFGCLRCVGVISLNMNTEDPPKNWTAKEVAEYKELEGIPLDSLEKKFGTMDGRSRWSSFYFIAADGSLPEMNPAMLVPAAVHQNIPPTLALDYAQTVNLCNEILISTRLADRLRYIVALTATLKKGGFKHDRLAVISELEKPTSGRQGPKR